MDRKLLRKYFRDECSDEELEHVLDWFQTDEGQAFLKQDIDKENKRARETNVKPLSPDIGSEQLFRRIQLHKQKKSRHSLQGWVRIASILLITVAVSSLLYWSGFITQRKKEPKSSSITYATTPGQQKVFTLSDGTEIRLNEESSLTISKQFGVNKRKVELKGEAYFEVVHDQEQPFVVRAYGAIIEDLGTKFNVKTDSAEDNVQVAVLQGKVSIKDSDEHTTSAILSQNHLGILRWSNKQITIEKENTKNYLSWMTNQLEFDGQTLSQISKQLENLHDVHIRFESNKLKDLNLTATLKKTDLNNVISIIAHALDIHFTRNKSQIVWKE